MAEYISNDFIDFCKKECIKKETIVPYNLDQNRVAERKNMSMMDATRAMLHDQKLPKFLSGEATHTMVYV